MIKISRLALALGLASAVSTQAFAAGLVLNDNDLRNDLAWLNDRGVIHLSLSTWPLSQEEIARALKKAKPSYSSEQVVLARIDSRLASLKADFRVSGYTSTDQPGTPQGFGQTQAADNSLSLAFNNSGDWWDVHLQGNVEGGKRISNGSDVNPNGSYGAVKFWNQWLSFGQMPQWWGPGYEGSLIRGDAMRPMTGVLMQRAEQNAPETWWLRWIGPWQYQISASQMNQYSAVPHAKIIGTRVTVSPFQSLELGGSRIMQWAGKGRPHSFGNFWDGFTGKDNVHGDDSNEPGNQLAGFDFKLKLEPTLGWPISFYGQMIGEDESGMLPSANMYLGGVEGHHGWGKSAINWYVEGHDTRTNMSRENYSYTHHIYTDGYYQQGYPLGDAMGGDGRLLAGKIELVTEDNQRWSTRLVYAKVNPKDQRINKAFPHSDTLKGVQLGWSGDVYQSIRLNTSLWYTDNDHSTADDVGASAGIEIPLSL
ncbi:capsule assembly Wzi family protein [Pluralibacter gergoviae]|uniref:capsule assembly Wzi family protein n=1 Tax=Pluralibacter gergoviae TaxID=61647 RepID=UPI00259D4811|nr:capsule assembly Wzi family protein [Pluralibacter gergoviae]EKW6619780.1 capsule assembly Wzi family protein [Pluralibacter gergoviae]ELD4270052.1 capsule assembly Wzi family protein [Pluralibacter gergoviae]ELD4275032.1 capsule assembly Wzi family protein [Pluralibacter gergoviae]ELD4316326.1 capsule assembly Wzi family protein [Pluralibacter gergoviae]